MGLIVIPAIDLMGGKAVRLAQGDRNRATVYTDRPQEMVETFASAGAQRIHIVDLDGAFEGAPVQHELVGRLAKAARAAGVPVEAGGGIRSAQAVHTLLDAGVDFVVVGTLAVREPALVADLCANYSGKIIVAADARDGNVSVSGWQEASALTAAELSKTAQDWGAAAVLYTEVSRDGMQVGPDIEATAALQQQVSIPVYASGGVGRLEHLDACKDAGIQGVVLGRALYEGAFTIEEAVARC